MLYVCVHQEVDDHNTPTIDPNLAANKTFLPRCRLNVTTRIPSGRNKIDPELVGGFNPSD